MKIQRLLAVALVLLAAGPALAQVPQRTVVAPEPTWFEMNAWWLVWLLAITTVASLGLALLFRHQLSVARGRLSAALKSLGCVATLGENGMEIVGMVHLQGGATHDSGGKVLRQVGLNVLQGEDQTLMAHRVQLPTVTSKQRVPADDEVSQVNPRVPAQPAGNAGVPLGQQ